MNYKVQILKLAAGSQQQNEISSGARMSDSTDNFSVEWLVNQGVFL
jgi:hypothetical protein